MRIGQRGLDLIKEFEGLELEAYQDIVGIWTIGYGHTSKAGPPEVVPGMGITEQEAERILQSDLRPFEDAVEKAVKVSINQNMFDALVSITFNIGPTAMRNSTFIRRLNTEDYTGAADAMLMWNKAGGKVVAGLARRREAERRLFLDGYNADEDVGINDVRGLPVEESSGRRGNIAGSRTMTGAGAGATAGGAAIAATVMGGGDSDEAGVEQVEQPPVETPPQDRDPGDAPADAGEDEDTAPAEGDGEDTASTDDAPLPDDVLPPTEAYEEAVEQLGDDLFISRFEQDEAYDAVVIGAGAIAIMAALYVAIARLDDWRNHRR